MAGDRRRADVDRDAVGPVVETRPDAADQRAVVDGDGHLVVAGAQGRLERPDDVEVGLQPGQVPFGLECVDQPGEVARSARPARAA